MDKGNSQKASQVLKTRVFELKSRYRGWERGSQKKRSVSPEHTCKSLNVGKPYIENFI